jgi:endonuclease YncB( thermonuclease family)
MIGFSLRKQAALLLLAAAACGAPAGLRAEAPQAHSIRLTQPVALVLDGDTFDADLNGDGRVDVPSERVRVLYVDTPELHESPKGKDVAHGAPAQAALAALLRATPIDLTVFAGNAQDKYGRTLARVSAAGVDVGLELIRQGHSYFDTRFAIPGDYDAHARAEAEAFDARRGIWRDAPSRKRYLDRLRREGKTPQSAKNALYVPGVVTGGTSALTPLVGKYVTVEGSIAGIRQVRGGAYLAHLRQGPGPLLPVFAKPSVAAQLGMEAWTVGTAVQAEGFVQRYKGGLELALHHAVRK